jgi:transcription elongation factor GreA
LHTDALNNKISIESPLGRALVGKRVNDIILISSPDGEYEVKILNIKEEGMS